MITLKGAFTALITPFTDDNQVDEEGLRELLRLQVAAKMDGIVLLGTTGESSSLSYEERDQVIQIAVEEVKGKLTLVVGCGTNSTQATVSMAKHAEALGADALLIVTPYYVKPTQEGIFLHFQAICNE
ncbi:MAG TPA: dihydrodipicolinate synthase family protein, partial [Chlamydiales bacterium]|nr:dihydrodipicolinate synthase family protein [Chlamydiales bacterium]